MTCDIFWLVVRAVSGYLFHIGRERNTLTLSQKRKPPNYMIPTYKTLGGYGDTLHRPLENTELRGFAPSIFAENAHARTSDRYSFLPTSSILDGMADEGWVPVAAQEQLVRDPSRAGFQKHMLRFAHRDDIQKPGGERPEIVIVNSHDRSSAYQLHAGIFRFLCLNGLVVCDETFKRISITHMGFEPSKVIEASVQIAEGIPVLMNRLDEMKNLRLTDSEREAYAEAAAIVRFGDIESAPVRPVKLLEPRRYEDSGNDAWRTFNVVQENATKGGQKDHTKRKPTGGRMPQSRAVKGIDGNVTLNKALWHLAEKLVELKHG